MFHLLDFKQLKDNTQLDIVGIVAVLGEASVARNAQASALGWHHVLPRLLPAPQALLKHEHAKRLPTVPGIVVGAYSGNAKRELNFFCQLLHQDDLKDYEVELVEVKRCRRTENTTLYTKTKSWLGRRFQPSLTPPRQDGVDMIETDDDEHAFKNGEQAYDVKKVGPLVFLSILGFAMSIALAVLSYHYNDGPAFLATFLLSSTSTIVGFASWWRLDFKEDAKKKNRFQQERVDVIPHSDVIIYYPRQGAFRIVRCPESIARLYFKIENCEYVCEDTRYRVLALFASALLIMGLLTMGNSGTRMQVAFAVAYIILNALYWLVSALNPFSEERGHWKHKYKCTKTGVILPSFTTVPGGPARSDTLESFRNEPVIEGKPFELPASDSNITTSPTSMKSLEGSLNGNIHAPGVLNPRRVAVTFSEEVSSSRESVHELRDLNGSKPTHHGNSSRPVLHPLTTTVSATSTSSRGVKNAQKQNTMDVEGLKPRHVRFFGSAKDACIDWLDQHKLISKRDSKKSRKGQRKAKAEDGATNVQEVTFVTALWKAIAITGTARWLQGLNIAPDNDVWEEWAKEAHRRATQYTSMPLRQKPGKKEAPDADEPGPLVAAANKDENGNIILPSWDCQTALKELFKKQGDQRKRRPEPKALPEVNKYKRKEERVIEGVIEGVLRTWRLQWKLHGVSNKMEFRLLEWLERAKARAAVKRSLLRAQTVPNFNARGHDGGLRPVGTVVHDFAAT